MFQGFPDHTTRDEDAVETPAKQIHSFCPFMHVLMLSHSHNRGRVQNTGDVTTPNETRQLMLSLSLLLSHTHEAVNFRNSDRDKKKEVLPSSTHKAIVLTLLTCRGWFFFLFYF